MRSKNLFAPYRLGTNVACAVYRASSRQPTKIHLTAWSVWLWNHQIITLVPKNAPNISKYPIPSYTILCYPHRPTMSLCLCCRCKARNRSRDHRLDLSESQQDIRTWSWFDLDLAWFNLHNWIVYGQQIDCLSHEPSKLFWEIWPSDWQFTKSGGSSQVGVTQGWPVQDPCIGFPCSRGSISDL